MSTLTTNINRSTAEIKDKTDYNKDTLKNQQTGVLEKYLRLISNKLELSLMVNYK